MALTQLGTPYPVFTDTDGKPLDAGFLYFGVQNQNPETNPITVYYDAALTQPAAQPLRTSNGYVMRNGSPAILYADSLFSVTVRNAQSELVIYAPVSFSTSTTSIFTPPISFRDVDALTADTSLSYAVNASVGEIVLTSEEGFSYEVAPSSASNQDITTAGGVKLYQFGQPQQWNLVGRPASVSVTPSGTGVLNGTYYWSVSYVTADGETDVSNATVGTPSTQQATVTIPVSTDPRVTARKIYRTTVGSIEPQNAFLVGTVSDNTTTTFVDNVADGSLGARAPHIDTSAGKILNGTQVIGAVSELSTTFGINAMPSGQGYACTAIGGQALENNVGGYRNTAVGTNALDANTTGFNNTAMGVHALDENTTGQDNTAFGLGALFVHPDGLGNTAVGANAAVNMTAGDENTFIGYTAGQLKTSGAQNVVVGAGSMYADGSGQSNTAVGYRALRNCTSGSFNMAFGLSAGVNITTGVANVLVGAGAGAAITTGERNVAIGPGAGTWEVGSNSLWIDGFERSDLADAEAKALIKGTFATTRAGQELNVNGQINPLAGLGMPGRTITADGAVTVDDTVLTCNKSGSTLTLTLPTGKVDKILILRNHQARTVVSASSNVQPIGGGAVGTAILPATVGAWAMIRAFDASNWEIIMRG